LARRKTVVGVLGAGVGVGVVVGVVGVGVVVVVVEPPIPTPLTAPLTLNNTACSRRADVACVALV
jgi:hypothetical protein